MSSIPSTTENAHAGKVWRSGLPFSPAVAPLVSRMELVDEYRQTLLRLQGSWDLFALLGQMSGIGAEIGQTRGNFQKLTETLLDSLACQLLEQRLHSMRGKAQVAIDILVRNLFERTADVGFLATDAQLCAFAETWGDAGAIADRADGDAWDTRDMHCAALQARFQAYVAKYSVYDDILVLATDGRVLARLDTRVALERSQHPLIAATLVAGVPYVESFGTSDLLGGRRGLLYSAAIHDRRGQAVGVLCLSFRFEHELAGIFARLLGETHDLDTVLALFDEQGAAIASSDRWQLPEGVSLPPVATPSSHSPADAAPAPASLRFAGREYLRVAARSAGYQGYAGPGWHAQALLPLEYAFRVDAQTEGAPSDNAALARRLDTRDIFDAELRAIPLQAQQIQLDLARSVWNGKLKGSGNTGGGAQATAFGAAFLHEVSRTGMQIRDVFEEAIAKLQTGAIAAVLEEARFHASLAIDIMDRNLYERANDCRWWALTPTLRDALSQADAASRQQASEVLQQINGLYTVYTLLVLFDAQGMVVAVSDPERKHLVGEAFDRDTVQATLSLRDAQQYHVGAHVPQALYGGLHTYVYTAALHPVDGAGAVANGIGGIAIVFDGAPQFEAMLSDALPRNADGQVLPGAFGLFVSRDGTVVASTDPRFKVGASTPFGAGLVDLPRAGAEHRVLDFDGSLYAVGVAQSSGYREYLAGAQASPQDVAAVVLLHLGRPLPTASPAPAGFMPLPLSTLLGSAVPEEIAGFTVGRQWFGLRAAEVEEVLGSIQIVALPNAPVQVQGLLKYQDEMVPVVDLAALLFSQESATAGRTGPILLCRTTQGKRIALRAGALGSVFEVDPRQLSTWQPHPGMAAVHLLSGHSGDAEAMLTVLTLDALWKSVATPAVWAELGSAGSSD